LLIHNKCLPHKVCQEPHENLTSRRHEFWNNNSWWQILLGHLVCWLFFGRMWHFITSITKVLHTAQLKLFPRISIGRIIDIIIHRWVDNIRMDLQELGCGYMEWTGLSQGSDRWRTLVSAVMNLRVPWNAGNFLTSCKLVSFSRRTLQNGVSKYNSHIYASVPQVASKFATCTLTRYIVLPWVL